MNTSLVPHHDSQSDFKQMVNPFINKVINLFRRDLGSSRTHNDSRVEDEDTTTLLDNKTLELADGEYINYEDGKIIMLNLDDHQLAKKLQLPKFLITIELLQEIKDPPVKNTKYQEINYRPTNAIETNLKNER